MNKIILVTGATGYVGGRLVTRLVDAGYQVRCFTRDRQRLQGHSWLNQVEITEGDALDRSSLSSAMQGVSVAYYLIHGMQGGKVYADRDLFVARNFTRAAEDFHVERIIYLGELGDPVSKLSPYLRSRHETGYTLRQGKVSVIEFRAGMIVGAGSVLFEMIRYLAEREPVLFCPRWFYSRAQPIAIRDVLDYLVTALDEPSIEGKLIEIGGETRLTYAEMLKGYARERQLKRILIPAPVYASRLSAYWIHMVTPIHWKQILPLIEGLQSDSIVNNDLALRLFPHLKPVNYKEAVHIALNSLLHDDIETSWNDALVISQGDIRPVQLSVIEGMLFERRNLIVNLPAERVFQAYSSLGGNRGWLYLNWTWKIRGWIDKLVGGVGLRRGRRHPTDIRIGESLDFWRVEAIQLNRMMRLRAEMKVPGKAWLEFQSTPQSDGNTLLVQTAYFNPKGLAGLLYWYLLYPIHGFIFSGMIKKIAVLAMSLPNRSSQ